MRQFPLLLFLTLLNVLNFVDRQLIPSLAPKLITELGLNRAEIGLLYGFVFLAFYTGIGLLLGPVADRYSRTRLIAAGLALWSLMTALSGMANSFAGLAWARMLVGVGEASLTPAALSLLSEHFAAERRAFATGFYYIGVPLGSGLSLIVSGWLAVDYGWRVCFQALGIAGLVAVPFVLLIKDKRAVPAERVARAGSFRALLRVVASSPPLLLTICAGTMINWAVSSTIHTITWMNHERGVPYQTAAYINGIIYTIAGMLGVSAGGWVSDWFHKRYAGGRLWFLVVKSLVFLPFALSFYLLPFNTTWYLAVWFCTSFGSVAWYGPVFATVQDLAPAELRSTALAFLLLVINLVGVGLGPWTAGLLGDRYGLQTGLLTSYFVGFCAIVPLFLAARRMTRG